MIVLSSPVNTPSSVFGKIERDIFRQNAFDAVCTLLQALVSGGYLSSTVAALRGYPLLVAALRQQPEKVQQQVGAGNRNTV
jgi:hypothetical protein